MCIHGHTCSHSLTPLSCPIVLLPFQGHTHAHSFPRQRIGAMAASSVSVNLGYQPLHQQKEGLVSPAQHFVLESDCRDLQVTPIKWQNKCKLHTWCIWVNTFWQLWILLCSIILRNSGCIRALYTIQQFGCCRRKSSSRQSYIKPSH